MLREYEFTVIIKGELSDADRLKSLDKYEAILLQDGGQVIQKNDWGVKKMAFPIKRSYKGHYVNYDLTTTSAHLIEAERLMRIDDNILRYLSVKIGEDVDIEERKVELAKIAANEARESRRMD